MNSTPSHMKIIYLMIVIFTSGIINKENQIKSKNLKIEFIWETVNHGIIQKFNDYFNKENESEQILIDDQESIDEKEYNIDELIKDEDKYINKIIESVKFILDESQLMTNDFKRLAEKFCLYTIVTKETTVIFKENIGV